MNIPDIIEKALNVRSRYHKVIAGNIANAETPGFKEKDVDFKKELSRQMNGSRNVEVTETLDPPDGFARLDENTVNIEDQVVKMTENNLMFNALVNVITKKFSLMRYVINEGRR